MPYEKPGRTTLCLSLMLLCDDKRDTTSPPAKAIASPPPSSSKTTRCARVLVATLNLPVAFLAPKEAPSIGRGRRGGPAELVSAVTDETFFLVLGGDAGCLRARPSREKAALAVFGANDDTATVVFPCNFGAPPFRALGEASTASPPTSHVPRSATQGRLAPFAPSPSPKWVPHRLAASRG